MYMRRGGRRGHCFDRSACRCDGRRESRGQTADIYFSDSIRHVHAGRASDPEPAQCVYKWGRIYCVPQVMTAWRKLFVYNKRVSVCWVILENKYLTVMYSYKIQCCLPFNNASLLAPSRMYKCFSTQRVHTFHPAHSTAGGKLIDGGSAHRWELSDCSYWRYQHLIKYKVGKEICSLHINVTGCWSIKVGGGCCFYLRDVLPDRQSTRLASCLSSDT